MEQGMATAGTRVMCLGAGFLSKTCRIIVGAAVAIGVFEGSAHAQENCFVENYVRICGAPNGTTTHGIIAVIGSDPWGHWVGWKDFTTDECLGWDWIGDTSGFTNQHTMIEGTSFSDYLGVISSEDVEFCGYPLDPPTNSGNYITLDGWFGGVDMLEAYVNVHVDMSCYSSDFCAFYLGGEGTIYGSSGDDVVVKSGGGSWNFWTYGGNDSIYSWSSLAPANADCGDGSEDYFWGERQGTPMYGCETLE